MIVRVACPACAGASAAAVAGIASDLAFCHPDVCGVVEIDRESGVVAVEASSDSDDLRRQVERVVALSVRSYRFVREEPPLWRNHALARYVGDVTWFVAEHVLPLGPGQYALVGPAAQLRDRLDRRFRAIARRVGAELWHLPSIESTHDLLPATGYLASHAQHVTFGYRLPCHFESLQRFATAARERRLEGPESAADVVPTGFILEPFVCHNVYRALRGKRFSAGRAITALGTCYRHEGFRFEPLLRQWEFSMREVVLVGPPAFVAEQRARLVELTQDLVRELDLDARLEIATDPFFVAEAASARTYQALHSTKLELSLSLGENTSTAACSFNLHGTHFTEPMQIRAPDGTLLETACIGWGLERWMAAVLARWGVDAAP